METKDPKSAESSDNQQSTETKDPKSDATSSETLSDVEETEKVPEPKSGKSGSDNSVAPSPDGAFDESRSGGTSGIDDPGPM